jgi:hypothetical protein
LDNCTKYQVLGKRVFDDGCCSCTKSAMRTSKQAHQGSRAHALMLGHSAWR